MAISAAGASRTDDDGRTWPVITLGLRSLYVPDPEAGKEDVSLEPPDALLPAPAAAGEHEFRVLGAIAGG